MPILKRWNSTTSEWEPCGWTGDADSTGAMISGADAKTSPADGDAIGLMDSADGNILKKLTWANLKAAIKSYYDSVTATLTNKTVNLSSNTLTGTRAQFNTALSDADFVTTTGFETLTNKTLTSPTLTTPSIGVATGTSFNSITGLASATPVVDGTATVGTSTAVAREDHVHPSDSTKASLSGAAFTGAITSTGSGSFGLGTDATERTITLGRNRTADGTVYIDLVGDSTYTTYGLRIRRLAGENGASYLYHRGTGTLGLYALEAANLDFSSGSALKMRIAATTGNVLIGSSTDDETNKLQVAGAYKFTGDGFLGSSVSGGFGAKVTTGTTDWNDATNARSGNGVTLLLGTATNGPGVSGYFHPFSFEYSSKNGSGNLSQFAIPYGNVVTTPLYFRTRVSSTWSSWRALVMENGSGRVIIGTITDDGVNKLQVSGSASVSSGISVGNAANAGATVLDWYEEGTFTPVAAGSTSAGTGTYTVQAGFYTRIGREVTIRLTIGWSAHTGTGGLRITGLPFTSASTANSMSTLAIRADGLLVGSGKLLSAWIAASATQITVMADDPAGGASAEVNAGTFDTAASSITITGTYMV